MCDMEVSKTQWQMLSSPAEMILFGGAAGGGKSHALLMDPLRHCQGPHANPLFRGALFRKTYPQLTQAGGLLDSSRQMYAPFNAKFNQTRSEWTFPCGAQIGLNTLQFESDIEEYLGAQWDYVGIDEVAAFSLKNILFFWSRCRSKSGVKPTLRMTANPDNSSFLFPMISWWLNPETGYPDMEKAGTIRHFIAGEGDKLEWSDEPVFGPDPQTGEKVHVSTSMTFIPSKLTDNTHLMRSDPAYYRRLMSMPKQDRERFLEGSWLGSSGGDVEWPRELFYNLYIPLANFPIPQTRSDCVRMFSIDPSKGKQVKEGDYSAIVCVAQTNELKYVDSDLDKRHPNQIVEDLFRFCDMPHHRIRSGDLIGCEALQFQELLLGNINRYADDHPEYALSQYLRHGGFIIPVKDSLNKMMRIRRLSPYIRDREFRFLDNPSNNLLLNQLKTFNGIPEKGKHDDGPDALDQACQMPRHLQLYFEEMRK